MFIKLLINIVMLKISQGEILEHGHGHEEEKIPSVNAKEEMF